MNIVEPREDIMDYLGTTDPNGKHPQMLFLEKLKYNEDGSLKLKKDTKAIDLEVLFNTIGMAGKDISTQEFLGICEAVLRRYEAEKGE
jgi:hypothetical protein